MASPSEACELYAGRRIAADHDINHTMNELMKPIDDGRRPQGAEREPVFNVPSVLSWIVGILWVIHIVRVFLLTALQDDFLLRQGGFIPARYAMSSDFHGLALLWSPETYAFLHGDFVHLTINTVFLVIFGAIVARRIGTTRFVKFWILSAAFSVLVYWMFNPDSMVPVIGASGVISALMGAAARFAFSKQRGFNRLEAHRLPYQPLSAVLSNKTVVVYVVAWFILNIISGIGYLGLPSFGARIAWEAHLGGFLFGFFAFILFDPQLSKIVDRGVNS